MGTAIWISGSKEQTSPPQPDIGQSSVAYETIEALQEAGLLDDIIATKEGLAVYPAVLDDGG